MAVTCAWIISSLVLLICGFTIAGGQVTYCNRNNTWSESSNRCHLASEEDINEINNTNVGWVGGLYRTTSWMSHEGCYFNPGTGSNRQTFPDNSPPKCSVLCDKYQFFALMVKVCICIERIDFSVSSITGDTKLCSEPCPGFNSTNCGSTVNKYADLYRHLKTDINITNNTDPSFHYLAVKKENNTLKLKAVSCSRKFSALCVDRRTNKIVTHINNAIPNTDIPFKEAKEYCKLHSDSYKLYDSTSIITSIPRNVNYWTAYHRYEYLYWLNGTDDPVIHQEYTMTTVTICDPCQSRNIVNTSVSWCMECEEELCFECTEYHTNLKMARNHHVVDLKLKTSYSALMKKPSLVCEQHKDCQVEYFCVDHDELCCQDCLAKTHKSCVNTMSLDSASKGARHSQLFSDCQEQLTSIRQTYQRILKYREDNVSGINDDKQRIKENVEKIKEKIIQRINQVEKELINKLDVLVQENTRFQQDEISKVFEVTEEVELYLKEMLFIVEHGSEKQAFLLCRKIDKYLHQADNELQTTTSELKRVTLSFDESTDILSSINTLGDVTVNKIIDKTITHKTLREQQAQFGPDKTTAMSTFKLQNQIEDTGRFITGMVVTDDDHLLLCDNSSHNSKLVSVYSPSGKYVKKINVHYPPWDIAIIPGTHRAVVTFGKNKIQFINLQTFTQDNKRKTIPNSTAMCGIASTSDNIIVGDQGRIHCLHIEGTYLRTIKLSTGTDTRYLSIGHNNQIHYSTASSINCVKWDGTEVFSYEIPNEKDHRKIAIDRNGNAYVAGKSTNTIQRLHSNGTVDCVVLNEDDEVKLPLSICFNKKCDKLYMADIFSAVVHVYSCS